jgi:hypothetical protein
VVAKAASRPMGERAKGLADRDHPRVIEAEGSDALPGLDGRALQAVERLLKSGRSGDSVARPRAVYG